jgi:hypothetical protein
MSHRILDGPELRLEKLPAEVAPAAAAQNP